MAARTVLENDRRDIPGEGRQVNRVARIFWRNRVKRLVGPSHQQAQNAEGLPPGRHSRPEMKTPAVSQVAARTSGLSITATITTSLLNRCCSTSPFPDLFALGTATEPSFPGTISSAQIMLK
jgi:hypothetical protein